MREDDSSWFSKWEDELPSPEELMPLSQTLITPDLASAFDIRGPGGGGGGGVVAPTTLFHHHRHHNYGGQLQQQQQQQQSSSAAAQAAPTHPNSSEFDSSSAELGGGGGGGGGGGVGSELGEPARTLKRPRLVWTPQLHKRFVDAVAHLGIKNAVPKTIMQLMSVDGLTRENVASHLQKYRLYLKRMQGGGGGISGGGGNGPGGLGGTGDAATDRLFASSPVPAHFLHQPAGGGAGGAGVGNGHGHGPVAGPRPNADHFMSYVPVAALHQQQIQAQYRQLGHFGAAPGGGGGTQFDHPFLSRQAQLCPNRNGVVMQNSSGFVEDVETSAVANSGRKVLTLFPTADD